MVELKRKLGFWQAYATATGLVVAGSTMVSLGNGFGSIGPAFIVAAFIAMIISIIIALSYAELSSIMPGPGMIGDYTLVSMGRFMSIVTLLAGYLVLAATVGPLETMTASMAIEYLIPGVDTLFIAVAILVSFLVINVLGVQIFGSVQLGIVLTLMLSTAVMGVLGLFDVFTVSASTVPEFNPFGWSTVMQAIALGLWLFIGIEFVIPMGNEVKKPEKTIPKAMIFGLITIFIVDMLFGFALTRHLDLATLAGADTPQIAGAAAMFGDIGGIFMAAITVLAATSSINANFAAVPRMFYGLARKGLLPKVFKYIHPKFRTPVFGIVFVFLLFTLPLFVIESNINVIMTLLSAASVTWFFSYIIAQIDVLILRKRYPNIARPFKAPFSPILQIIGIAACVYMIVTITPDWSAKMMIYGISGGMMLLICMYAFIWLKYKKLAMFTPISLEELKGEPESFEEEGSPEFTPTMETVEKW